MKLIKTQPLKGFRDFLPEEAITRDFLITKIKIVFEQFGFDPIETPALESAETLLGKYGKEADKLIYLFNDRGGRKIGLKYDQTVPLARLIAFYQNLPKPFKRYQIQPVWRAENPQKGRFREFIQCDIDIVGEKNLIAEAEIIVCALETAKTIGFTEITMIINDRKIFSNLEKTVIISLDKLPKIGEEGVIKELIGKGLTETEAQKLIKKIKNTKPTKNLINLFLLLKNYGLKEGKDFKFEPILARGLDYYTGPIFELISKDYLAGSLGGGGRYDHLIGQFTGKNQPAVGFAFGFDRLLEAAKEQNLIPQQSTKTKVLVTIFSNKLLNQSINIAQKLRKEGINTEIYLDSEKKLDKQLKYADRKRIPYVIIIGEKEVKRKVIRIKNMKTGEQKEISQEEIINFQNLISNY